MSDFEVIVETLRGMAGMHDKVHDDLMATNQQSAVLTEIPAPMEDEATVSYITAACQAGRMQLDSVTRIGEELQARIDELKASAEQYAQTEDANNGALVVKQ